MASEAFTVFYNKQVAGPQLGGGKTTLMTKAQAEAAHRNLGKEPIVAVGPLFQCELVEIEAENAQAAATAARLILGAYEGEGELTVVKSSSLEKKSGR